MTDHTRAARREVLRCRGAVEQGTPINFWLQRLGRYAQELETAAAILRDEIARLKTLSVAAPTGPHIFTAVSFRECDCGDDPCGHYSYVYELGAVDCGARRAT